MGPALSAASTQAGVARTPQASRCVAASDLALLTARGPSRLQAVRAIRHNERRSKAAGRMALVMARVHHSTSSGPCGLGRRRSLHEAAQANSCDHVSISNCLMQPREKHVRTAHQRGFVWSGVRVLNGVCALMPSPTSFCCDDSMQCRLCMCTATEMQKAQGVGSVVWVWPVLFLTGQCYG